tara:strand:- start:363 stop:923 length:561 start_codon:yes stop_codon:yes gene_type:complete
MEQLLKWDSELFIFLNSLGQESWDPIWLLISGTKTWIPFYLFLLFLVFKKFDLKIFGIAFLILILNTVFTDTGSVWLFKEQFQRLRPCHVPDLLENMRLVKESCGGKYGFVSSHASNTFGLAVLMGGILKEHYSKSVGLLLFWSSLVALSRVYLGVHYPLDIICGAIYGAFCGYLSLRIFRKITIK